MIQPLETNFDDIKPITKWYEYNLSYVKMMSQQITYHSIKTSIYQPFNQLINQSINQSDSQSTIQSVN